MNKRNAPQNRSQRGVALMMTLGVLALLLIMAMSFAYTSKTDRMAAGINADLLQARLMCESGLSRVIAAMKYSYAGAPSPERVYPPTWTQADGNSFPFAEFGSSDQHYMVSANPDTVDDSGLPAELQVPGLDDSLIAAIPAGSAEWVHILGDVDGDGTDDLVGRFAYLVLDESGKIDPTAAVTPDWEPFCFAVNSSGSGDDGNGWPNGTEQPYRQYFFYDVNANGTWTSTGIPEGSETRTGTCMAELVIPDAFRANLPSIPWDRNGDSNWDRGRWFSLQHLFDGANLTLNQYLALGADSYDIEAYHNGTDQTDYHRFDLSGMHWDPDLGNSTNGWDELATAMTGPQAVAWLDSDPVGFWQDPANPSLGPALLPAAAAGGTGGIRAMRDLVPDARQRREVLASLIDYSDSNLLPTWGDTDGDGRPDFVGLEMSPYNNEVEFQVAYAWRNHPHFGMLGRFLLHCELELINPYDAPGSGSLPAYPDQVYVQVKATFGYGGPGTTPPGMSTEITWSGTATVAAHSYAAVPLIPTSGTSSSTWVTDWHPDIPLSVTAVEIRVTQGSAAGGALLDSSYWTGSFLDTVSAGPNVIAPQFRHAALQTNDPRCNTWDTCWAWTHPNDWRNGGAGDIGHKNSLFDFGVAGADPEDNLADPKDACQADDGGISTWYVRNGPMRSLWELGAIHRAQPWATLNLRSFAAGDARLLSQTKLGPWTVTTGKFNVNSPLTAAWNVVLPASPVYEYDDAYNDPGAGSDAISLTGADMASHMATASNHIVERGALADLGVGDLQEGDRDRELESTIGRLANLLTVRQNYYTVIVVGQSVKDLKGNNPGGADVCEYDTGRYCRVLAQQKVIASVYRDALRNRYRVDRVEYLEE
ncbi:MAG: hypothetical protein JXR77_08960 [Lentisphaeria bacterium]|nr:hypothetical protein [Lentisphaeria bacterium]